MVLKQAEAKYRMCYLKKYSKKFSKTHRNCDGFSICKVTRLQYWTKNCTKINEIN